ncbi:MAG: CoA ester lyase [Woeseiaceae bacterium]|nr:CoA ester lyase [Woeseiaceae bacterium]
MSRSFLFVPADSESKLDKAAGCGADALILDLEDSVPVDARPKARELAAEFLNRGKHPETWVRINPLASEDALLDLQAVMPARPHGIVLPKPESAADARLLSKLLLVHEEENGLGHGVTAILPIATERPAALFSMDGYADTTRRLAGLTWGAEDLSAALGASANRDGDGNWLPPYQLARSLCLLAAAAAAIPAIDTVFTDYKDARGLAAYAAAARRDGFEGMLAIHPGQVGIINEAFVPTDDETERAQRIVDLFAANPDAGTLGLDGEMIDRPHWLQAKRILETASRLK